MLFNGAQEMTESMWSFRNKQCVDKFQNTRWFVRNLYALPHYRHFVVVVRHQLHSTTIFQPHHLRILIQKRSS